MDRRRSRDALRLLLFLRCSAIGRIGGTDVYKVTRNLVRAERDHAGHAAGRATNAQPQFLNQFAGLAVARRWSVLAERLAALIVRSFVAPGCGERFERSQRRRCSLDGDGRERGRKRARANEAGKEKAHD